MWDSCMAEINPYVSEGKRMGDLLSGNSDSEMQSPDFNFKSALDKLAPSPQSSIAAHILGRRTGAQVSSPQEMQLVDPEHLKEQQMFSMSDDLKRVAEPLEALLHALENAVIINEVSCDKHETFKCLVVIS